MRPKGRPLVCTSGSIAALILAALSGCSSAPSPPPRAGAGAGHAKAPDLKAPIEKVTPSRILPDVRFDRGVVGSTGGRSRILVDRIRLIAGDDGSMERASELLPIDSRWVDLPSRLGGGHLFFATTGSGVSQTQIWRASSWLARLEPLVQIQEKAQRIVPGFDRIYIQTQGRGWKAIDLETGQELPIGPLPPAPGYGEMVFADGWRAVVDLDLRGPVATFDAGLTWRPLGVKERVSSMVVIDDDPTLIVAGGRYSVDPRGALTYVADASPRDATDEADEDGADERVRPAGPFGRRPLRTAVEDGWPDSPATAVVARAGSLARISLADGAVLAVADNAYPDRLASCHAVRLAGPSGIGFVCGEHDGPTTVYAFAAPLAMKPVLRFARPRFVSPSGNGALVIRGTCSDGDEDAADAKMYCVIGVDGTRRPVKVVGELGFERVVALADGRVALIVPPRPNAEAQLSVITGTTARSVPLTLPAEPRAVKNVVRRGMWLDGFEEREPGVISGWVEAGGPVVGIQIALDGKVTAGDVREDAGGAILAGRFGLSRGDGEAAAESTDGGVTWRELQLPRIDEDPDEARRACGPAGCVLGSWIRVGWGSPAVQDDLAAAQVPPARATAPRRIGQLHLECVETGQVTPPLPEKPKAAPPRVLPGPRPPPAPPSRSLPTRYPMPGTLQQSDWKAFRNTAPPPIAADEIGFDSGVQSSNAPDAVLAWVYTWGRRGADWNRAGRLLVRFDDPFDPGGGVRSSAITASPWADEASAADAVGRMTGYSSIASWSAIGDPSGKAALLSSCKGAGCSLFAAAALQPPLPIRDGNGRAAGFMKPWSAVRVGETWFFVSQQPGQSDVYTLWRAELGVARPIRSLHRWPVGTSRLVRRALGGGIGVLVHAVPDPGLRSQLVVYPIDPDSGDLGDPVTLGRRDLIFSSLERCTPQQDGWQVDLSVDNTPPVFDLKDVDVPLDSPALRLRLDPGASCLEGVTAKLSAALKPRADKPPAAGSSAPADGAAIPLAATERVSNVRHVFRCVKTGG